MGGGWEGGGSPELVAYADPKPHLGDRLYTSESDVYRRQILTYKDGPRTERVKILILVVVP